MENNHRTKINDRPTFRPFDPSGEGRVYVRNLPHWRQPGATYFVTFRQDDSIPAFVLAEWIDNRDRWYRANGINPSLRFSSPKEFDESYKTIPVGVRRAFERAAERVNKFETTYFSN